MFRTRPAPICSFCGADAKIAAKLIAGPAVHICDRCVELCNRILAGEPADSFARQGQSDEALLHSLRPAEAAVASVATLLQEQVDELRRRGVTWQQIGEALGVSRQAVWERFSSKETR